jgi:hypothetical protein
MSFGFRFVALLYDSVCALIENNKDLDAFIVLCCCHSLV